MCEAMRQSVQTAHAVQHCIQVYIVLCIVVQSFSSEQDMDSHMCYMSTSLVSCQFLIDLCTINILYANKSERKTKQWLLLFTVIKLVLKIKQNNYLVSCPTELEVFSLLWSDYNWHCFQETVLYINMWFIIILFPVKWRRHLLEHMIEHFSKTNFRL